VDLGGKRESVEQVEGRSASETLLGACLFPKKEVVTSVKFRTPPGILQMLPLDVVVTMEYRGPSERAYRTSTELKRTPSETLQRVRAT
jgi:hypothetical protein